MNSNIHRRTPALAATDGRGMAVRQVAYLRAVVSDKPVARISTQQNDVAGRLVAQRDPRFSSAATRSNQTTLFSLSGAALLTDSVDAGWRLSLTGETGQVLEQWDGRGSHWQNEYDDLRRPIALHEYALGAGLRTVERLTYADNSAEFAERNQCGSLIRHDDSSGTVWFRQVALNGGLVCQTRRFLPDQAGVSANWPANEVDRDLLLQPGEGYTSESRYGPSGEVLEQIDAGGHLQQFKFDRAGQLQRIDLTLKGKALQPLLRAADYNAAGQLLTQIAGNNVTNVASYQPENGRLECLTATTSTRRRLQEMSYEYDPVGNILRLVDHTQADSYFDNQRVAAENAYTYDSLYQLTSAKGRETAGAGQNPGLPELNIPSPIDPTRLLNYSEYYEYDAGGNRTLLRHESDKNPFSRQMYVDPQSNRALSWNEGVAVPDFSRHFDANGNLQYLASSTQPMTWDARNQLQSVINVQRPSGISDGEWYRYNAAGERAVKFSTRQARTVTHQDVVHYLPGLEVRTADDGEELQVIHVQLAHGSVRCLHWVKGPPDGIDNGQLRYSIDDHLGSSCLELDQQAAAISHEGYYPNGGTAWWAARSKVDADYKTIRYSGKERDASGLYYYGARYYAGWLGRWINPDPAGNIDGLNLYRMTGNNPISYIDLFGNVRTAINKDIHLIWVGEDANKLKPLTDNINNTATQADGYKVHLYLDSAKEDNFSNIVEELKIHDFIPLRGSELFNDFQNSQTATIYNDFRSGSPLNFAHAVDVLRMFIVEKKGGIYSDVDDYYFHDDTDMHLRLGDRSIGAEPDELRTLPPVSVPWEAASTHPGVYINNSSFAAHPGNTVLKEISKEMVARYNKIFDLKQYNDDNDFIGEGILHQEPVGRFKIMSSMVGPGLLTDVYKRIDNEIGPAIENIVASFSGKEFDQHTIEKTNRKLALGRFIRSGDLASWRRPL
ncbi:RHS repeat-associated core domain-containing protein [Pseudomonas sp. GM48]|uniref:RHS repeat-associated core domain-containing protein n=1 Tax=Pseudomonas sp. GM48 TaxID=1144330 RepID=UPI000519CFA4|nr:RHS repeat-associated core domain-containing protein [Pseudomonas sp. GM48]